MMPSLLFPTLGILCLYLLGLLTRWVQRYREISTNNRLPALGNRAEIVPAEPFNLSLTKPPKLCPFKPNYHLTMGIESLDTNDLLLFDQTYPERIRLRRSLLCEYPKDIIGVTDDLNARIRLAVQELYRYLFQNYLPCRYPSQFRLCGESGKDLVENLVTHEKIVTEIDASIALREALETIAGSIDEDFFILLPYHPKDSKSSHETYVLEAYAACFPSGFQPREKIGKKLADIHEPVPGYREKLEKSMDRFFARLEVGRLVKRVNWSLTVDEELYSNFDKGGTALKIKPDKLALEDLNLQKTFVRCERQTLHRLPESRAIVFAFHTYLYPIQEIKAEGNGEVLAAAIDGLQGSKIPGIFTYKNGEKWADAVREFLRS
ncbi:unnamed protein product [Penicillium olsonii]|nr:unnamed protein product [Penicillium olsonii]